MSASNSSTVFPSTMFDDFLARTRLSGQTIIIAVALISLVNFLGAAYLDGLITHLSDIDLVRTILLQPTITLYILLFQYFLRPSRLELIETFRGLIGLNEQEYRQLLAQLSPLSRRGEWSSIAIGVALGILLPPDWGLYSKYVWTNLYIQLSSWIMFGLAGWGVYSSLALTRLFNNLHRQPMEIDLFHPTFLEPIARRSLSLALAYVGALTLSVFFIPSGSFQNIIYFAILYATLILFTIFLFLLSMRATHQLLVNVKKRELSIVRRYLSADYRDLKERAGKQSDPPSETLTAWLAYEKRILEAPEWPFNTQTIQSLVASLLLPIGTLIARIFFNRL